MSLMSTTVAAALPLAAVVGVLLLALGLLPPPHALSDTAASTAAGIVRRRQDRRIGLGVLGETAMWVDTDSSSARLAVADGQNVQPSELTARSEPCVCPELRSTT